MSMDLIFTPSCGGCGSTVELHESTCHGKTMTENGANCTDCGLAPLIPEVECVKDDHNSASLPASSKSGSAPTVWDIAAQLKSRLDLIVAVFKSSLKLEEEVKSMQDEPTSFTKSNPSTISASPPASSKSGSASPSGPVTEHVVPLQTKPVAIQDLEAKFKSRLNLKEIEDDISSVLAPKNEASKEEPVDNKSTASEAGSGTPSTLTSSVGKRRRNGKESKSKRPTKRASPPASSKSGSAPLSISAIEDEIRAFLQGKQRTIRDLGPAFCPRLTTRRAQNEFLAVLKRIAKKRINGDSYLDNLVFLREETC